MESGTAKLFADINGVRQGMFVQCQDPGRPVLLCVHGGLPEFFMTERYPTGLENDFTLVWWEQRGMGLSFSPRIPPGTMTTEQFVADTLALTRYLLARFGKEQICLMAHSGGTFFALQAAARAPELYSAYVGVAQAVRQLESERLAQEYMLRQFRQRGDKRMARTLGSAPVSASCGTPRDYLKVRDRAMHRLGVGTTREMTSVLTGIFWPSLTCSAYTPAEKVRLWRGKLANGVSALWDDMLATDLAAQIPEVSLPAYFLHGIHDYTVSYRLARQYEAGLRAPLKGFYTFGDSAHSPVFEEPEKARRILRDDVLAGTNDLADDRRLRGVLAVRMRAVTGFALP